MKYIKYQIIYLFLLLQSCASIQTVEESVIVFFRTDSNQDIRINIYIDEKNMGSIGIGQTRTFSVTNGEHNVSTRSRSWYNNSSSKIEIITVNNERCYIDLYLSLVHIQKNTPIVNEKSIEEEVNEILERKAQYRESRIPKFYSYNMADVNLTIEYNCSDDEAFSWTKYWITENFKRYVIRFEDSSLGLLSGSWSNEGLICDISSTFEFLIKDNNAVLKFQRIRSSGLVYSMDQEGFNNYTEMIINGLTRDYRSFIQSK